MIDDDDDEVEEEGEQFAQAQDIENECLFVVFLVGKHDFFFDFFFPLGNCKYRTK